MKSKKLVSALAAAGIGLALAAAPVQSQTQTWSFQDDDLDFLFRVVDGELTLVNPTTCVGTACNLAVGDILVSVFEFPSFTISGSNAIPTGEELTGIAAIQFAGTVDDPVFGIVRTYTAPDVGLNAILALGDGSDPTVIGGAAGESAMAAMWLNSDTSTTGEDRDLIVDKTLVAALVPIQPNCTSFADCIDEASKGSLLQVDGGIFPDGTLLDPDNFWLSGTGGSNINTVLGTGVDTQLVAVNAGLSTLFNTVEPVLPQNKVSGALDPLCVTNTADNCVDIKLSATVNGGTNLGVALNNGAFAYSTSITAQKYVQVPEPGSLSLLGAALLGAFAFARRKFSS